MKTKLLAIIVIALLLAAGAVSLSAAQTTSFRFASIGDGQGDTTGRFISTVNQVATHDPAFVIFNGDLENNGVTSGEMNSMINALRGADLFDSTFLVRGNHDDHVDGSASAWERYFETSPNIPARPAGVMNYFPMNSSNNTMNYSFDYGNSIFIGLDTPGDIGTTSTAARTFLDTRLTYAEGAGLTHAFIFFHSGEYCISSIHCSCTGKADGSCTPTWWVTIANKHPIISATFHGHEHVLGWVQMDKNRIAGLTGSYQEFFTSPAGGWTYNQYVHPLRVNDFYDVMGDKTGFAIIDVNGDSFTVSFYKVGTGSAVWSRTFSKSGTTPQPTSPVTVTATPPAVTRTATQPAGTTRTPTKTRTPAAPTVTRTPAAPTLTRMPGTPGTGRPLKYYGVDRVLNASDFVTLAGWGANFAVINVNALSSVSTWQAQYNATHNAGMDIVIWPSQGESTGVCGWDNPFKAPQNGDYIWRVKPMLNWWQGKAIGIVIAHEPMWNDPACKDSISDMAAIASQIRDYAPTIKIWNYIDNVSDIPQTPGYTGPADYDRIADVMVTWQHCAGGAEGPCTSTNSALSKIIKDRQLLDAVGSSAELVFLVQTFTTSSPYGTKFTLTQLQDYSCQFLGTNALDGFAFYTWSAWWPDLHSWTDLQPAIAYVHDNCIGNVATPIPGATATITRTPAPVPTRTATRTRTPAPVLSVTPTAPAVPTVTATPIAPLTPTTTPEPTEMPPVCSGTWKLLLDLFNVSIWACYK